MIRHVRAKIFFVLPFHLGHAQEAIDKLRVAGARSVARGRLILVDVAALKPARAVHRQEPSRQVTERAERAPDDAGAKLTRAVRLRAELFEHPPDEPPVMPFLFFDLADAR